MLLALANWLATDVRAFNVFGYITLRAVLATMTALVISFVVGPYMIRKLAQYRIGSHPAEVIRVGLQRVNTRSRDCGAKDQRVCAVH